MPPDFESLIDRLGEASGETKALLAECHGVLRDMRREKRELLNAEAAARQEQRELRRMEDEHIEQVKSFVDEFKSEVANTLRDQASRYYDQAMEMYRAQLGISLTPPKIKPWHD